MLGLIKARHPELDRYTPPSTRPAVLAYFGWPQAHEDAGLAIAGAVRHVSNPGGEPLAARIGIATGPVMVGELIGEGAAQEEAVVGETPNLAARLQAIAEPGAVVISQVTCRLVGGLFELVDLGRQPLRGFAKPLAAFRVAGGSGAQGLSRRCTGSA